MIFAKNPVPMAISEPESGKFIEVNAAFLKKLHYKMPDIVGKTASDLGMFAQGEKQKKVADALQKKGYIRNIELKIRTNTGAILNSIFSEEIIESQNKKFLLTVIIDISKHRQREKKIKKNLAQQMILAKISAKLNRYKNFKKTMNEILKKIAVHVKASRTYIFENSPDKKTASNTFEWCAENIKPRIDNLQNISFDENFFFLKKLHKQGMFLSRDISKLPTDIKKVLESRGIKSILVLPLTVNNKFFGFIGFEKISKERKWHASEIIILRTIAASISGIYEKKQNTKEIKSKTEQINREKNKVETIIQSIGDGVFVVDRKLRILLINPIASRLSGYSEKEALNKNYSKILRFVHESDPQIASSDFITQAIATGESQSMPGDTLLISKKGEKIPVADSAVPLKNDRDKIIGCVVVFRDATREREINRMKSEFVSLASHQLKTPMTGIKWMSELILKENISDKQKDYMNDIHESVNKLVNLIDDLLNLSHIETGSQFNIVKKNTDLSEIIEEIIKDSQKHAQAKKIDIKYKKNPAKLMLSIDRDKIKQALGNVFNNSIKYSLDSGRISVDIREKDKEAVVRIKDNGIGIPRAQQKRIFEKFFRANNAAQSDYGTGLGLSITKSIIEAHDGHIRFESKEGGGATFYVGLPLKNI
ncbi:PAS domain S-box protein [Candidatus Parcubacteria bacterium]|nr:PAS domain S-box protein [Candidatus Parcubacteria bacterium]